jgi:hypothetical protein
MIADMLDLSEPLRFSKRTLFERSYITLISTLLCDRSVFQNRKYEWLVCATMTFLRVEDRSSDELCQLLSPFTISESSIGDELKSLIRIDADRISLCDTSRWHIMQCWMPLDLFESLEVLAQASPDVLLPFSPWTRLDAVDMNSCLRSRYLFAFLYDILFRQLMCPSLAIHYALNLFILIANETLQSPYAKNAAIVTADSIETLAGNISANFHEFIRTSVYYNLEVPCTLIQVIVNFAGVGAKALMHSNIGWSRALVAKPGVAALKQSIFTQFDAQKQQFEEPLALSSPDRRPVCRASGPDDVLVDPCIC